MDQQNDLCSVQYGQHKSDNPCVLSDEEKAEEITRCACCGDYILERFGGRLCVRPNYTVVRFVVRVFSRIEWGAMLAVCDRCAHFYRKNRQQRWFLTEAYRIRMLNFGYEIGIFPGRRWDFVETRFGLLGYKNMKKLLYRRGVFDPGSKVVIAV